MKCEQFMQMLERYADLSENEMNQLEAHAEICETCRAELEFMNSILGTVQELPPIEPPQDFLESLNSRLDRELAEEPKMAYFMRQAKPYVSKYGTIAACLAVGIVIGANGNMLVSRMENDGNGVISSTTEVTDNGATPVTDTVEQVQVPEITPEAVNNATVEAVTEEKPQANPAVNTGATAQKPIAANTVITAPSTSEQSETAVVSATVKPAVPEVTAVTVTPEPVVTAEPKKEEDAAVVPDTAADEANAGIMTASLDAPEGTVPAAYSIRMIEEPEEAPEEYAAAAMAEDVNVAAEYSMATMSPVAETAYVAPLSSTLMVKSEDEARAREIIMEFVEATYGNYYMITGDKLYNLTLRLESEGIWYQANITDSGVKVSFKLVTK